jgi:hypothetical protein
MAIRKVVGFGLRTLAARGESGHFHAAINPLTAIG